jgi:hypothetical protein
MCGGHLLERGQEYTINHHSGRLAFNEPPSCDSILLTAFRLPRWLMSPSGNAASQGKRLLDVEFDPTRFSSQKRASPQKISISGNKSFSFTVGRAGEGRFSQGLNVDFDARIADDLRLRGSVSDRGGTSGQSLSGEGGTMILSELDKYFFEIEGKRITARGGDIDATRSRLLPAKRIKGIYAAYADSSFDLAVDVGRPAGRFVSQRIIGIDGRQGPYQVVGGDGRPTGIVPGSEKVYLDGRLLEGGADKHYLTDYPSGRLTFSPRVLITSRSRIEIDFEAAANDYEQVVYDAAADVRIWAGRLKFSAGGRRETDDKDELRFGSFSDADLQILRQAGDTASRAFTSGAIPDSAGNYILVIDTAGEEHYQYAGSGGGDYTVSFTVVGEGKGDYRYLGDGVYQYVGKGVGDYMPIRSLPLPISNDFFFSSLEAIPYSGAVWRLEYQGNIRDNNLFSSLDDGDNLNSQLRGQVSHTSGEFISRLNVRFRQEAFNPVYRIDPPDNLREWALPAIGRSGDEFRFDMINSWITKNNRFDGELGYLKYRGNLRSHRLSMTGEFLSDKPVTPRFNYAMGNSEKVSDTRRDGLYEKYGSGLSVKPVKRLRIDVGFEREFVKGRYDTLPSVEKYIQYRGAVFFGRSVLAISRRVEFESTRLSVKGPQQDKIELTSEESFGRFQVSLAGTWFDQKRLDSERDDRTERLFVSSFRYTPGSGWITLQAGYRQNRRSVRAFGFRYVKVTSGEGDYRLEDDRYLFDPEGDYIRIREELGEPKSVSVGEKNHNVTLYPGRMPFLKRYQGIFSQFAFRLRTDVSEEMPGKDRRTLSWLLPWASRSGIGYVKRFRRERYTWLLFPTFNFYVLNFSYANSFEEQESGGLLYRNSREYEGEIKNQISEVARSRLKWQHRRRDESGAGGIAMNIKENSYSAGLTINPPRMQITPDISYTAFSDIYSGGEGNGVILNLEAILRQQNRGEIRFKIEGRSLTEKIPFSQPEFLVTDGKRFGRSAMLSLVVNYEITKSWRITINLTDHIYEGRSAEFVGRGELLARF